MNIDNGKKLAIAKRLAILPPEKQQLLAAQLAKEGIDIWQLPIVSVPQEQAPLSFAQQRLWFIEQMTPGDAQYNLFFGLRFEGDLNVALMEEALNLIIQRHHILRSHVVNVEGTGYLKVRAHDEIKLNCLSLNDETTDIEPQLKQLADAQANEAFNLEEGPLFRFQLVKIEKHHQLQTQALHIGLFTIHHLVFDAWSVDNFILEFSQAYHALSHGTDAQLPTLPIQYQDFASWQRRWAKSPAFDRQVEYWKNHLTGVSGQLKLCIEKSQETESAGKEVALQLPTDLSHGLYQLTQQQNTTLYMTMLAVFSILLRRYSGETDICVGTSIANRPRLETESLLGYFVNTLVMRNHVNDELSFANFLSEIKRTATEAYEHQDLPFEHLLELLSIDRSEARSPIFQVLFVMNNASGNAELQLPGVTVTEYARPLDKARFDLSLRITEPTKGSAGEDSQIRCHLEFNTGLFDESDINVFLQHYQQLLQQVVKHVETPIAHLNLITPEQATTLLAAAQGEDLNVSGHAIHQLFEQQVQDNPEAIAIKHDNVSLSYEQLNQQANQLAHFMLDNGIAKGRKVALLLDRSTHFIVSVLAVLKTGGVYVPLDTSWPKQRIATVLKDCAASLVLSETDHRELVDRESVDSACATVLLDKIEFSRMASENPGLEIAKSDIAYMIYTSGTTGKPKGVMVTHGNINNYCQALMARLYNGPKPLQFASVSTVAADLGNTSVYGALCFGGCLNLVPKEIAQDADDFACYMKEHQVDILKIVPGHLRGLLAAGDSGDVLPNQVLIVGGETCSSELVQQIRDLSPELRIINHYGPTESTVGALTYEVPPEGVSSELQSLPIGKPLANYCAFILDDSQNLCAPGMPGELYIGGAGVASGYHDNLQLTLERFIDWCPKDPGQHPGQHSENQRLKTQRLYRTGDKARRLPDGNIAFLGRLDEQVKIRGYRVELGDIEAALLAQKHIQQAAVLYADIDNEKQLIAFVASEVEQNGDEPEKLRTSLATRLPDYMLPQQVISIEQFPVTLNGKLDRKKLLKMAVSLSAESQDGEQGVGAKRMPSSPNEILLADIWGEVLNKQDIAIDESFFDIGGDSILSLKVIAKVKKAGFKILPKQLFDNPTIEQLVAIMKPVAKPLTIKKVPKELQAQNRYPLSFSQQRLWFLDQLQGPNAIYNIPMAVSFAGQLDVTILEQSFVALVERHQSLRTRMVTEQGQAWQSVEVAALFAVERQDFTLDEHALLNVEAREELARNEVINFARHPFDIHEPGLFKVKVIKLAEQQHWLLVNCHHIIADGWSMHLMVEEFCHIYQSLEAKQTPKLTAIDVEYRDFAFWQHNAGSEYYQNQWRYWQKQLSDVPALLDLPTDFSRPAQQSYRGAGIPLKINGELTAKLKDLAQQQDCTLYMVLLAAWQVLLHRYSGQNDICVGSPIANRHFAETQPLVGFFANTVVLRGDLHNNPQFSDFLQQIKQVTLDAQQHQDIPFEQLVDKLQIPRDTAYAPIFQTLFSWGLTQDRVHQQMKTSTGVLTLENIPHSADLLSTQTSKFDVELALREFTPEQTNTEQKNALSGGIEGRLEYATDLFKASTIESLWQHFIQLLNTIVAEPHLSVAQIPLLLDSDKAVLNDFNQTQVDYSSTGSVEQLFARQVSTHGHKIAATFAQQSLSYQALDQQSNQLANLLMDKGVKTGQRVLVCQARSLNMLVSLLAVLKAGGAYVPVDPSYPAQRVRFMATDADPAVILTDSDLMGSDLITQTFDTQLADGKVINVDEAINVDQVINVDTPESTDICKNNEVRNQSCAEDLAYLIYTSGSTGTPKAVQVTRGNMLNFLGGMQDLLQLSSADKLLAVTSLSFDISVLELFLPLMTGAQVVIADETLALDGQRMKQVLQEEAISIMQATPVSWKMLLSNDWQPNANIKALCGGEAFPLELADQLLSLPDVRVWNMYGPTETTVWSSVCELNKSLLAKSSSVPIGHPIANTQLFIMDDALNPVPQGVAGELCIAGAGVTAGYRNQPELSHSRFVDTPFGHLYRTGDLARFTLDGNLYCLGRMDQQVKVRGFRIELGEIESQLLQLSEVKEALVYTQQHNQENILVAYVVAQDASLSVEQQGDLQRLLKTRLQAQLPDYMLPAAYQFMDQLPLTPNGKIDKKALPELDFSARKTPYVKPRNDIEARLCGIWQSLLGLEQVGAEDNFFESGGHSLLAARLKAEIEAKFSKDISLIQMFSHQTVASLATLIAQTEEQFKQDDMDWMDSLMDSLEEDIEPHEG